MARGCGFRGALLAFLVLMLVLLARGAVLFVRKLGLTPEGVRRFYLGAPEVFAPPRSALGLLEVAVPHLLAMPLAVFVTVHLVAMAGLVRRRAFSVLSSLTFAGVLVGIAAGFVIRFLWPGLAWVKIAAFAGLEATLLGWLALLFAILRAPAPSGGEAQGAGADLNQPVARGGSAGLAAARGAAVAPIFSKSEKDTIIQVRDLKKSEGSLGFESVLFGVTDKVNKDEIKGVNALLLTTCAVGMSNVKDVIEVARRDKIPTAALTGGGENAGVVLTIVADPAVQGKELAAMVKKILGGAKPSDITLVQPKNKEIIINNKEAKALGISIPAGVWHGKEGYRMTRNDFIQVFFRIAEILIRIRIKTKRQVNL